MYNQHFSKKRNYFIYKISYIKEKIKVKNINFFKSYI